MKTKQLFLIGILLFSFIGISNAQLLKKYYVVSGGRGLQNGSSWNNAFPDINVAIDSARGNVMIMVAAGEYEPVRIWNDTLINNIQIYGGFNGSERKPEDRDLSDPNNRTIIRGNNTDPALWIEKGRSAIGSILPTVVDGITLIGGKKTESLALRVVGTNASVIISRCRIEQTDESGNLIFLEGVPQNGTHLAIINSVISNNNVSTIIDCYYGCKFINTTIANNQCSQFMKISGMYTDTYEIQNCIFYDNTNPIVTGNANVDIYYSMINDISGQCNFFNGNVTVQDNIFSPNNTYDPYSCIPNQYTTRKGDYNMIDVYLSSIEDSDRDIIGNYRYDDDYMIDMGAYQSDEPYQGIQYSPKFNDREKEIPDAIKIYPTILATGESIYIENITDINILLSIYNINGMKVYSSDTIYEGQLSLQLPNGVYMVIISDALTGKNIYRDKIIIR